MLNGDLVIAQLSIVVESVQQLLAVSRGALTTNLGIVTIEVPGDFLERRVTSLDEEEVNDNQFDSQPAVVNDVVLPGDVADGNWVDVVVEEESTVDEKEHDSETLGTNLERENFDGVTDEKTGPSQIVGSVVKVDHSDDGAAGSLAASSLTLLGADCPCDEAEQHTSSRGKEQWATTKVINHEGHSTGNNHVPDLKNTVDQELVNLVGDTDLVENEGDVVRNQRVTRPLGEETGAQADEHSVAVTLGGEKNCDALFVEFSFEGKSFFDFDEFVTDEIIVEVTIGVVLGKNGESLFVTVTRDQPTWRFWDEPDEANHDTGWAGLEDRWSSPGPLGLDLKGSESSPGGDNGTDIPCGVVDGGDSGTMLHVSQFGDEQWCGAVGEGDTETDQEASADEHSKALGGRLEGNTDKHDAETDHDGDFTTSPVGQEGGEWDSDNGTNRHDGVEETELRRGWLEVVFPVVEGLETVHHGAVETVGCRDENDSREKKIELSETRFLVPGNLRKLATTKDVALVDRWCC